MSIILYEYYSSTMTSAASCHQGYKSVATQPPLLCFHSKNFPSRSNEEVTVLFSSSWSSVTEEAAAGRGHQQGSRFVIMTIIVITTIITVTTNNIAPIRFTIRGYYPALHPHTTKPSEADQA